MVYPQPYPPIASSGLACFYLLTYQCILLRSTSQPLAYQDQLLNAICDCYTLICLYNHGSANLTKQEKDETLELAALSFDRTVEVYLEFFKHGEPFGKDLEAAEQLSRHLLSFFDQDKTHLVQRRLCKTAGAVTVIKYMNGYKLAKWWDN